MKEIKEAVLHAPLANRITPQHVSRTDVILVSPIGLFKSGGDIVRQKNSEKLTVLKVKKFDRTRFALFFLS